MLCCCAVWCVHMLICICMGLYMCVHQKGSLAGRLTAVGTEIVHCPPGERWRETEQMFTVKKL